jgi:hypothetical protein
MDMNSYLKTVRILLGKILGRSVNPPGKNFEILNPA